jgi:CubicO group peptidase (beta-lactamase class C family)
MRITFDRTVAATEESAIRIPKLRMRRNILVELCVLASMEKIPKTDLYQRGIPLLAFLPMLAFLSSGTAAGAESFDEWELASPATVGLDPVLLYTLVQKIRAGEFENIHSLLIVRSGKLVIEEYFKGADERRGEPLGTIEFNASTLHDIRSITKSVTSALFGIALAGDPNRSIDDSVLSYFPEYKDLRTQDRLAIRLRDLLSMTAGWEWNEKLSYRDPLNSEIRMDIASDRYRFVLERPIVAKPRRQFTYNSGCTVLIAAVIERWTKMPLDKYAEQQLFQPLGISKYEWLKDAHGTPIAASGLRLRPRDLAKFASLYLDKGRWHESQVIPEDWIDASLMPHIQVDGNLEYGYQWWLWCNELDRSRNWGSGHKRYEPPCKLYVFGARIFYLGALFVVIQ